MNYYAEAIDGLSKIDNINYRDVIFHIAKNNPSVLVKACRATIMPLSIREKVIQHIKDHPGEKIKSIKYHREITGEGLKESKAYIEEIISSLEQSSKL